MLLVTDIIRKEMKKKGWDLNKLSNKINKMGLNEVGIVRPQNISNMLNDPNEIRPVLVKKIEIALKLPKDSLMRLLPEYEYSTMQERVDEIERRRETYIRNMQVSKKKNRRKGETRTM